MEAGKGYLADASRMALYRHHRIASRKNRFTTAFGESARLLYQIGENRENFLTIGEEAVLHSETRLGGIEDAETEEIEPSSSLPLPFQAFQPMDLALDLPLAESAGNTPQQWPRNPAVRSWRNG
jgi:hypothetical protein